jgi:hypothetical protein
MNDPNRRGRFLLAWFIAGIAVLPLSAALWFAAVLAFSVPMNRFNGVAPWFLADESLFAMALFWLINGFCIGNLQKAIVQRYLRVDLRSWSVFSVLGAMLAGIIAYPCLGGDCFLSQFYGLHIAPSIKGQIEFPTLVAIYLTVLSLVQYLALYRIAKWRWRWVAAHLGSLLLAVLLSMYALAEPSPAYDGAMQFLALLALIITPATGIMMLRLLSAHIPVAKVARDRSAYQPARAESPLSAKRFVSDDAV